MSLEKREFTVLDQSFPAVDNSHTFQQRRCVVYTRIFEGEVSLIERLGRKWNDLPHIFVAFSLFENRHVQNRVQVGITCSRILRRGHDQTAKA